MFFLNKLKKAEFVLNKIAAGKHGDWQTTAAMRYFGWTWDKEGNAIPPEKNKFRFWEIR